MSKSNWTEMCKLEAMPRRLALVEAVQAIFAGDHPVELSTYELLELIYPQTLAHGEAIARRRILYKDLEALQDTVLACYNHRGAPEKGSYGKLVHRRRWHAWRSPEDLALDWQARALAAEAKLLERISRGAL